MHFKIQQHKLKRLFSQRRSAWTIILGLFILCWTQMLLIWHLIDEQSLQLTPVPSVIHAPFQISRNQASNSYLAQMGLYFVMLRLNYTPATLPIQARWLLHYTDSAYYGAFKQILVAGIQQAKSHDIASSFAPVAPITVNSGQHTLRIAGDLTEFVGKVRLPTHRVCYQLGYHYQDGQLSITAMQLVKEHSDE